MDIDEQVLTLLKRTAMFAEIESLKSQDGFHSKIEQLGMNMQSAPLCQKILLHRNSFDEILGMSDVAVNLFGLVQPPIICGVLYGAISMAALSETTSDSVLSEMLNMIAKCDLDCAKLCAHYRELPNLGDTSLQQSRSRFAGAYKVVLDFLSLVVIRFNHRGIRK